MLLDKTIIIPDLGPVGPESGFHLLETTEDGKWNLSTARCLGCCGLAPVMSVNGDVYGKLTKNQIAEKVDTSQKEGRLTYLMQGVGFKSEGLRLASRIAEMKKSIKSQIEQIKKHNPARYTLFSINLAKPHIKDLKDNVEHYLSSNNIAMDSAEFKEIQSMLDDLLTDFDL